LAEQLEGEIISVDSMQVYSGPGYWHRETFSSTGARVPHHLIDIIEINAELTVAHFVGVAQKLYRLASARVPVLCGGTCFTSRRCSTVCGQAPPGNAALRFDLERSRSLSCWRVGVWRIQLLSTHRSPKPRRVRALEVIRVTGKAYSLQRADWSLEPKMVHGPSFGLMRNPADLQNRIDTRVDAMFRQGFGG
jgi:tRNA dimethylallyltransferase